MLSKAPIKKFARVGAGQGAPQKDSDFSSEGNPFIRAGSIEELLNGGDEMNLPKVNSEIAKQYKLRLYQPNTIVFAKSGMSAMKGRIYKLKNPCYVVNHLATLELNGNADPDFVVYTLREFSPVKLINDISYPSLKQSKIEAYEIPLPSLSTQIQIANILSKAEALIEQRKQSIALLDEFLKSTFLEMFGEPGTNSYNWTLSKLQNSFLDKPLIGSMIPAIESGTIPIVRVGEIGNREINFSKCKFSNLGSSDLKKYRLVDGDILLARAIGSESHLGKASIFCDKGLIVVYDSHVMRLRFDKKKIHPEFFYTFLQTKGGRKRFMHKAGQTSIQFNINSKQISDIDIPVPPIKLQNQFAAIVTKTEALKEQYKSSLQELENLYGSLSQKAFKGQLFNKAVAYEENNLLTLAADGE